MTFGCCTIVGVTTPHQAAASLAAEHVSALLYYGLASHILCKFTVNTSPKTLRKPSNSCRMSRCDVAPS